jgi:acetyl-CoA acetyltransferase/uncharacterized OB-fold protein
MDGTHPPAPAIEGWFTCDPEPTLLGQRCAACGAVVFPPTAWSCPNPACDTDALEPVPLSRRGRVWSYTDARYQPPPPYVATEPFEPFALAAVELEAEGMLVLGQVTAESAGALAVGAAAELVVEPLWSDEEADHLVWKWRVLGAAPAAHPKPSHPPTAPAPAPTVPSARAAAPPAGSSRAVGPAPAPGQVFVAGVGMHPWGKWGRNFASYGLAAARAALADAGLAWTDVQLVCGADTIRNGYPGFVAGATVARALGFSGARVTSSYAACASGAAALATARAHILAGLCDVALVVGADTTPKGFFAPVAGDRPEDPDWLRFRLLGATNPTYFALYARRRMACFGATAADFAAVKAKSSEAGSLNPYARYRKPTTVEEVLASPVVADPLHLLDVCATSDGAAAVVLVSDRWARRLERRATVQVAAVSTVTPTFPVRTLELPDFASDAAGSVDGPAGPTFRQAVGLAAYEEAGVGPGDVGIAEVYDLSTALELDWCEDLGLCEVGEAESLIRRGVTALGGALPVNPSGGLASFGEAIPAQALAQVCELTWQLRGDAGARQVPGARVGITANQGLFGHGSSVVLIR